MKSPTARTKNKQQKDKRGRKKKGLASREIELGTEWLCRTDEIATAISRQAKTVSVFLKEELR